MSSLEAPQLPKRLARLFELAFDLWWTWNPAREVFRTLDYRLWRRTAHNPVRMLRELPFETLERASNDPKFLARYDAAIAAMDANRSFKSTWWDQHVGTDPSKTIAYFSAEFALHQTLPIYAGGLGVLAGDHCKEASDLGVPLIGVGFMYPQGYFRQRISAEGWQQEVYERIGWENAPVSKAVTLDGQPCIVMVPLDARNVLVQVWQVRLGRVRLFLLDTDLAENAPWDRELSARLYGGGQDTRLQQEIVLGLGGVLALRALGITPAVWHLNEGHAAFVVLQRIRDLLSTNHRWDAAIDEVRRTTVFTTHTPVPAGHDAFPFALVEQHLAGCWGSMGEHRDAFLALGDYDNGNGNGRQFNMTALAMRTAGAINAVSQLHGEVTREMFQPLWPDLPAAERPVHAITHGVHAPTWIGSELCSVLDRHLGAAWRDRTDDPAVWEGIMAIPDEELWAARNHLRHHLFHVMRERIRDRWTDEGASAARVMAGGTMFDPNALTIGFARRFTGYKRPDLVFRNAERLAAIVNDARRPVQIVFAGKAHPADEAGKHSLQNVFRQTLDSRFAGRVAFIDDYDLHVAHFLVQGCDVWLNNPRKPLEASGTSGMKASMNGTPHLSIGDGWWAEGYDGTNGWLIDSDAADAAAGGNPAGTQEEIDTADANALYTLLENEIVPAYYERDERGIPLRWLTVVRRALITVTPRFSTRRMLKDYVDRAYAPAVRLG
jgi:starch phosphorylase